MIIKKRLLVLSSTFPRWKNDTIPPFVYELSIRKVYKFWELNNLSNLGIVSMIPGDRMVAGCFIPIRTFGGLF